MASLRHLPARDCEEAMKPDEVVKLMPCPFCGREAQQRVCRNAESMTESYLGARCDAHTHWMTVEQWNHRTLRSQLNAALQVPVKEAGAAQDVGTRLQGESAKLPASAAPDSGEMPEDVIEQLAALEHEQWM